MTDRKTVDDGDLPLDEASARQIVLARAIDDADTQGKLVGAVEREQVEREALEATRPAASGGIDFGAYLRERARRLIALVEHRNPRIAALQDAERWHGWLLVLLPLAACVLGAALDRIDNPHQVNMLSPPLLGVLAWNLAVYVLLVVSPWLPHAPQPPWAALRRRLAGLPGNGRRTGRIHTDVLARFHEQWLRATAAQQWLWFKQLLHLSAAGWALGLAFSIVMGGVVREYRVGWESTLLGLDQVHALLRALFAPVVALGFDPFTAADLQRMSFHAAAAIPIEESRRWVWMYVALLFVVVIVPRVLLATWAAWQRRRRARAVHLDLREPYYVQLLARVSPARITLALVAPEGPARDAVLRMLRQVADPGAAADAGTWTVLSTARGDVLRAFDVPPGFRPPSAVVTADAGNASAAQAWLQELLGRFRTAARPQDQRDAVQATLADSDLMLLVAGTPGDVQAAARLLQWVAQPVLVLAPDDDPAYGEAVQRLGLVADVLPYARGVAHWLCDTALLDAAAARIDPARRAGFDRLAATWKDRNAVRFAEAMRLLAAELARAARDVEEVGSAPVSLRHLVNSEHRDAAQRAREAARNALLARLRTGESALLARLVQLHGTGAPVAPVAGARVDSGFHEHGAVDSPQAGIAGAATGAAMGASIDLLTGGLTLGAAAALGALIGGGAAYTAAVWKNRASPSGQPQVQLGDELLQTFTESVVLAYLAVAHRMLPADAAPAAWRADVVAAVEARREQLAAAWQRARNAQDASAGVPGLARVLEDLVRGVLERS